MREIIGALFSGYNYRLYTEGQTRTQLLDAFRELMLVFQDLPADAPYDEWLSALTERVGNASGRLEWWLLGLGQKTANNLGVNRSNRMDYFREVGQHLQTAFDLHSGLGAREAMLMLWAGAATLTVRGSQKSRVGKRLEAVFMRAGLTLLGLEEGVDFWAGYPGRC